MNISQLIRLQNKANTLNMIGGSKEERNDDILLALLAQQNLLEDIRKRQSWLADFSSNIAGNAVYDGIVYVFSKLIRQLK